MDRAPELDARQIAIRDLLDSSRSWLQTAIPCSGNTAVEGMSMRRRVAGAMVSLLCFVGLAGPAAAENRKVQLVGSADQIAQIERSLTNCPTLELELETLARSGAFSRIRITTSDETGRVGPFLAAISGHEIILASEWLKLQDQPFSDVRVKNELLPDNLCFDLGHLADHLANPPPKPQLALGLDALVTQQLIAESHAFLRAWPYVLEAAIRANKGKPLTGAQAGGLLVNLRYRFAFLMATTSDASPKLDIRPDGTIPDTDLNAAAIRAALMHATIADLQ